MWFTSLYSHVSFCCYTYVVLYVTLSCILFVFFFFKQKTAYEMRISDWSSDVCSSDLLPVFSFADGYFSARGPGTHMVKAQDLPGVPPFTAVQKIGRASCRERVCQYV